MEGTSENLDEVDGSTSSSPQSVTIPASEDADAIQKDSVDEVPTKQVNESSDCSSGTQETIDKMNGSLDIDSNDKMDMDETPTTNKPEQSKEVKFSNGTESEDDSEGLVIDMDQSQNVDDTLNNQQKKIGEKVTGENNGNDADKEENGEQVKTHDKQESESNLKIDDQHVDYFEKLENSLREFEKTLEGSNVKTMETIDDDDDDDDDMKETSDVLDNVTTEKEKMNVAKASIDDTTGKENVSTTPTGTKAKEPENDMKEMEKLLKEFQQTSHYSKLGESTTESSDKSQNGNIADVDVNMEEIPKSDRSNSPAPPDENAGKHVMNEKKIASSETVSVTHSVSIFEKKKMVASGNASDAWSLIGMKRCPHCSFTTDQDAMLQSHTVLYTKKKTYSSDIMLKCKANHYGCESCLYTIKLRRHFKEHIAFHLLAQPCI